MSPDGAKVLWRVQSADGAARENAFDALVMPTNSTRPTQTGPPTRRLSLAVPYDEELPNIPLVLVVRARAGGAPLIVECDVFGPDGERRVFGRSQTPLAVIVLTGNGIRVSGLPDDAPGSSR